MTTNNQNVNPEFFYGNAAEDIGSDTIELKVTSAQLLPGLSGPFGASEQTTSVSVSGINGEASQSATVKTTNYVTAYWWGDTVRSRPPLIRKGELVQIFTVGDNERFYWLPTGRNPELRKLDRFRIEVAATPKPNETKTDENTYVLDIDPSRSTIMIKTSKANEEPYVYLFGFDTKAGQVTLKDDNGNQFFIDSKERIVQMTNKDKVMVQLNKRSLYVTATDDIVLKAGRQLVLQSGNMAIMATEKDGAGALVIKSNGITFDVAKGIYFKAKTVCFTCGAKFQGVLRATAARMGKLSWKSALGSLYNPTTINIEKGTGNVPDDTEDPGSDETLRHAAAYEDLVDMASEIVSAFGRVTTKTGQPGDVSGITSAANASKLEHIQDQ